MCVAPTRGLEGGALLALTFDFIEEHKNAFGALLLQLLNNCSLLSTGINH